MSYDSRPDTRSHIHRVRSLIGVIREALYERGRKHDASKLVEPELAVFDEWTPKLKTTPYSVDPESAYQQCLREMQVGLDHHYANNSHHPQFFANGIDGMSLIDIIEMLADWKAAGERQPGSSLEASIQANIGRFNISPQLASILENTRKELGW